MPNTVPNQRIIKIHRIKPGSNYLGIKNDNWQAAARDLGAHGLMLYLYFSANADNFQLALSPAAIRQAVGMPTSTYRDQFLRLIDKGYIVQRGEGNTYDFFESPQRDTHTLDDSASNSTLETTDNYPRAYDVDKYTAEDREINIYNNKQYINNCGEEKQVSPSPSTNKFVF